MFFFFFFVSFYLTPSLTGAFLMGFAIRRIPRGPQAGRNGGAKQPSAVFHGSVAWAAS